MDGVIVKDLADLPDGGVDAVVGVEKDVFAPDPLHNLIPGHQLATILNKEAEEVGRDALELEYLARLFQFETAEIEFEITAKAH